MAIVRYQNIQNTEVLFSNGPPFILTNLDGIGAVENELSTSTNYGSDGATKTSQRYVVRDITIEGRLVAETPEDRDNLRQELVRIFNRDLAGTLTLEMNNRRYLIDVEVSQAPEFKEDRLRYNHVPFQIMLKALNPYWRDASLYDALIPLSLTQNLFEFPLDIVNNFEFATVKSGDIIEIINRGDVEVGAVFFMRFIRDVKNPRIYNVLEQSFFGFKGTYQPDVRFELSTVFRGKYARKIIGDERINAMPERLEGSTFLTLRQGSNYFQIQAEEGVDGVLVDLKFQPLVIGV